MNQIGNKLIEINVTDSSLDTPEAGTGFLDGFNNMIDGLMATPLELVLFVAMMVAIPLCIFAIILVKLHNKQTGHSKLIKNGDKIAKNILRFTPIAVAVAIIATPLFSHAIINPTLLDNSPISITIDKATALSATGETTVTFEDTATSHVDIYAALNTNFDNNLGSNLTISTANTDDLSSTANLSTTTNHIYTTGPVTTGETTIFNVKVDITEDLPVGTYKGQVDFYGDYIMLEEFKFTIDTTLDRWGDGYSYDIATYSNIDAVKDPYLKPKNIEYNWLINCDTINNPDGFYAVSGISNDSYDNRLTCHYDEPGQYQISIRPNDEAVMGWLDAYGGPWGEWENSAFLSIDAPLTNIMRTANTNYRFAYMFSGSPNLIGIPADLFSYIDTSQDTNFEGMFEGIFARSSLSSTAKIPSTLFSKINTANATNMSYMFSDTFSGFAYNSEDAIIPFDLFNLIDTSSATNLTSMFANTFRQFGQVSTTGSIPAQLFDAIDTSNAIKLDKMFYGTFEWYASNSENGTIPQGLFDGVHINNKVVDLNGMFHNTFAHYSTNTNDGVIPESLFATITTANVTNLENMFRGTFHSYGGSIIPHGLFDSIDTSEATNMKHMFNETFYLSKGGSIPDELFTAIRVNSGDEVLMMFYSTFGYYDNKIGTGTSDIYKIWGNADLSGITASVAGGYTGVFYYTFNGVSSLTGSAQDFINDYLSFTIPTSRAYTFTGTGISDLGTLAVNWK